MHSSEYRNIFLNESSHFYYVGYQQIIFQQIIKFLANYPRKKIKILDAGCGPGFFSKRLSDLGETYAIDISKEAIKYARKRGVQAEQNTVTKIPHKNNYFDLVVCLDVLYHQSVEDERLALKEFNRVLKHGGYLVLKLPAFNFLKDSHDLLVHTRQRYTLSKIKQLFQNTKFLILKSTYLGTFLFIPKMFSSLQSRIMKSQKHSDVKTLSSFINNFLILLFKVEEKLLHRINLPFGITTLVIAKKI